MARQGVSTVEAGHAEAAYMLELLSYLLGVSRGEVSRLLAQFSAEKDSGDPQALFSFLAAQTRQYVVLWGIAPHTDQLSIVPAAVLAPGREVVWWAVAAVPYGRDNGAFRLWHRVLEAAAGMASLGTSRPSESDFWGAEQLARQYGAHWPGMAAGMAAEMETVLAAKKGSSDHDAEGYFEDPSLTRRFSGLLEQRLRDALGKGAPLAALRMALVSLPELRDLGLEIVPLQQGIDGYLESCLHPETPQENRAPEDQPQDTGTFILPKAGVRLLDPVVDPLGGVPLSAVSPGDMILLQSLGDERLSGRVYLIRVMRNGQFEIHGHLERQGAFFKAVAPGDIKISLAPDEGEPERSGGFGLWFVVGLAVVLVAVLLFLLLG